MTKTPEELTKEWKAKKLEQDKDYYVELMTGDIVIDFYTQLFDNLHYPQNLGFDNVSNNIINRILAPVPTYDEYKATQEQLNKEGTWYTEISYKKLEKENNKLRGLLKECKEFFEEENPKDFTIMSERMDELLTRINAAIGESEER